MTYFDSGPLTSLIAVLIKRWSKPTELTLTMTLAAMGYGLATAFVAFFDGAILSNGFGWIKLYMLHGCLGSFLKLMYRNFKLAYS